MHLSFVQLLLMHIVDVARMMVVVEPIVELHGRNGRILATFVDISLPLVQRCAHLHGVVQVFQLCQVIDVDAVFLKG